MIENKWRLAAIVLIVVLVLFAGFIGNERYQNKQIQKYQLQGYQQAVSYIVQQVSTCQQVPIAVGNQTINIVAVECLR